MAHCGSEQSCFAPDGPIFGFRGGITPVLSQTPSGMCGASVFHPRADTEDRVLRHPAVDAAAIVADLKTRAGDRLDQMQIFVAADLAQHDVAYLESIMIDGRDGAELAGGNAARHRMTARPKLHGFALPKAVDI